LRFSLANTPHSCLLCKHSGQLKQAQIKRLSVSHDFSHDREPHLRERVRSGLRAVAADHNQAIDAALLKLVERLLSRCFVFEFRAARASEHRAAALDDTADIARAQGYEIAGDQSRKAVTDAEDFPAAIQPRAHDGPERFRGAHQHHIEGFGETKVMKRSMGSLGAVYGLRSGGEEFPIEASISQMESNGQKLFTVILRDITERKRAEERLVEQAALFNQAQDAILVRSLDDRIFFWNQGAERIYGWTVEEAVGRDVKEMIYRNESSEFEQATRA